jgi:hypothetical protein
MLKAIIFLGVFTLQVPTPTLTPATPSQKPWWWAAAGRASAPRGSSSSTVGSGGHCYCSPRHPTHFEFPVSRVNSILRSDVASNIRQALKHGFDVTLLDASPNPGGLR